MAAARVAQPARVARPARPRRHSARFVLLLSFVVAATISTWHHNVDAAACCSPSQQQQQQQQQNQLTVLVHLHPPIDLSPHSDLTRALDHAQDNGRDSHSGDTRSSAQLRAAARERVFATMSAYVRASQTVVSNAIRHSFPPALRLQNGSSGTAASLPTIVAIDHLWIQNTLIVRMAPHDAPTSSSNDHSNNSSVAAAIAFFEQTLVWLPGVRSIEVDDIAVRLLDTIAAATDNDNTNSSYDTDSVSSQRDASLPSAQRNIALLHAPALWRRNVTGRGVVVASIDSGVRYTHEALRDTFRGYRSNQSVSFDYAFWFPPGTDVSKETPDTADVVGHGTHTMGTAVGRNGIGVSPDATWITARAFDAFGAASKSDFLLAAQWVLCPTTTDGSSTNCTLGADVVSNSFGIDRKDATASDWQWLTDVVRTWRAAGAFAAFASGNTNGFVCGSVFYPASLRESVAVGALIGGRSLWGASGKGPVVVDDVGSEATNSQSLRRRTTVIIKPDVVAPGVAIRSALSVKDDAYTRLTGTSMATPHVAGAIALLLSLDSVQHTKTKTKKTGPAVSTGDVLAALMATTTRDLAKPFLVPSTCGNTTYRQYPNNIYGYGLPNVCRSAATLGFACTEGRLGDADAAAATAEATRSIGVDTAVAVE